MDKDTKANCSAKNNEKNPIEAFGDLLGKFIEQSKIVRNHTITEMIELSKKLKEEIKFIINFNLENFVSYGSFKAIEEKVKDVSKETTLLDALPYDLIVRICTIYDTFLSNLLKEILYDKSMVGLFEKNLSLQEISKYGTKEELFKYCIEIKIDEIFRKSHQEQIEWIEKNFNIQIRNSFNNWKQIVLFFEMRNIIVHNNGIVNRIFIENIEKSNVKDQYKIGERLVITPKVLKDNINNLFIFSIYIFSLLLGKLYKKNEERKRIDYYVVQSMYELLLEKEYNTVIEIANHCLQKNQIHSNSDIMYITINKCIALKCIGEDSYKQIIEKIDWSNCKDLFLLAKNVLLDNYEEAAIYMQKLGNDENQLSNYIEWPLFDWFRETQEFHTMFKIVFGIEFEEKLSQIAEEKALVYKNDTEEKVNTDSNEEKKLVS